MTYSEFIELLKKATASSVDFGRKYIENDLPEQVRFRVLLNQSYDIHATVDERVYPEDDGIEYSCLSMEEVAKLLVRDERCPEWVDVSVASVSAVETHVRLLCCGRFTDDPSLMYYAGRGMGPFGIKSPDLPFAYKEGTKFKIPVVQPCAAPNGGHAASVDSSNASGGPPSVS